MRTRQIAQYARPVRIIAIIRTPRHQAGGERMEAIFLRKADCAMHLMRDGGADAYRYIGAEFGGCDFK